LPECFRAGIALPAAIHLPHAPVVRNSADARLTHLADAIKWATVRSVQSEGVGKEETAT